MSKNSVGGILKSSRRLRMGMVGGGQGTFIGDIHRLAARLDGQIELFCGAISRDPESCKATGKSLGLIS